MLNLWFGPRPLAYRQLELAIAHTREGTVTSSLVSRPLHCPGRFSLPSEEGGLALPEENLESEDLFAGL